MQRRVSNIVSCRLFVACQAALTPFGTTLTTNGWPQGGGRQRRYAASFTRQPRCGALAMAAAGEDRSADMASRGQHLVRSRTGGSPTAAGVLGRLAAPAFARLLDHLHERLGAAGSRRRCPTDRGGGSAFIARVRWRSFICTAGWRWSGWRRRGRSAGTGPGRKANGRRPTRCRCSSCSCAMARRWARSAGPRGRRAGINALMHRLRDNGAGTGPAQHRRPL